jgi:hypothetical protein
MNRIQQLGVILLALATLFNMAALNILSHRTATVEESQKQLMDLQIKRIQLEIDDCEREAQHRKIMKDVDKLLEFLEKKNLPPNLPPKEMP